jgi:hypothetical protein
LKAGAGFLEQAQRGVASEIARAYLSLFESQNERIPCLMFPARITPTVGGTFEEALGAYAVLAEIALRLGQRWGNIEAVKFGAQCLVQSEAQLDKTHMVAELEALAVVPNVGRARDSVEKEVFKTFVASLFHHMLGLGYSKKASAIHVVSFCDALGVPTNRSNTVKGSDRRPETGLVALDTHVMCNAFGKPLYDLQPNQWRQLDGAQSQYKLNFTRNPDAPT